ncbi:protein DMP3-like [Argentina anserina]|uniref:protein DMP3-like n=1 Tax=Argentina anserina TaxID=57926 RepID=UPI00217667ED|nr:protein DMP3-like [Potentilla anserina]
MSLRPSRATPVSDTSSDDEDNRQPVKVVQDNNQASSISQRAISQTLTSTANLANLLPTGTLLAFQLLIPVFTNNGSCDAATRPMTLFLLLLFALSCFLASFTDSVKASNGQVYYGMATRKGLFVFDSSAIAAAGAALPDLIKYRLSFIDFVHAFLSVLVFGAVAFRDKNVVGCLYPMPGHETQEVLDIVPIGVGLLCSLLFVVFPTTRHGIGYPLSSGNP